MIRKYFLRFLDFWFIVNFPVCFFSVYFHEFGHYIFSLAAGCKPKFPKVKITIDRSVFTWDAFVESYKVNNQFNNYAVIVAGPYFTFLLSVLGINLIVYNFYLGISLWLTNLFFLMEQFYFRFNPGDDLNFLINFEEIGSFHEEEQLSLPF